MKFPWLLISFLVAVMVFTACTFDPAAFSDAVFAGTEAAAPAVPHIPGAVAGNPLSWAAIASYILNAVLGAWGTYERRQRKKVTNA